MRRQKMTKHQALGARLKVGVVAAVLVAMPGVALQATPANAQNLSGQVCAGASSASNGTWTFAAGTGAIPPGNNSICSLATTASPSPNFQYESLAASELRLSGTGDLGCGGIGTTLLASPGLSAEVQNPGSNLINTGVGGYFGFDNEAFVVWTAVFANGVGELTGTLYGARSDGNGPPVLDPNATPEPVDGVIAVNCADPTSGAAPNTVTLLRMPSMPRSTQP